MCVHLVIASMRDSSTNSTFEHKKIICYWKFQLISFFLRKHIPTNRATSDPFKTEKKARSFQTSEASTGSLSALETPTGPCPVCCAPLSSYSAFCPSPATPASTPLSEPLHCSSSSRPDSSFLSASRSGRVLPPTLPISLTPLLALSNNVRVLGLDPPLST